MQHLLFFNSISIGFRGRVLSNGFIYAMPFPTIVCLGINDVLLVFKAADIMPLLPGSMRILFLAVRGIDVCCMYSLCVA